jgi:DNA-binding GntR family transcriptional regulator
MANGEQGTVTDRAYFALRELLTSEGVGPGDHIGEIAVAEWLNMSRTPVRAALQRLEQEQLVRRGSKTGYAVAGLSSRDVRESCDVLRLVDSEMFIRASENLTPEAGAELTELSAQMLTAAADRDVDRWSEVDTQFHELVRRVSDHRLLADIAIIQRRRLHRFWRAAADRSERLIGCAQEHNEIASAIVASDHQEVRRIVIEHIGHMEASLLRNLEVARPFIAGRGSVFSDA